MTRHGLCRSREKSCPVSSENRQLDELFPLLQAIDRRRRAGDNFGDNFDKLLFGLEPYLKCFQSSDSCAHCRQPLAFVTQPTAEFDPQSAEYRNTTRLNKLLECIPELQSLGFLLS